MKLTIENRYTKGDIIATIRQWSGLTQVKFAQRIGKTERTVQRYEANELNYNIDTLLEIAKIFNLKITIEQDKNDLCN